MAAPTKQWDGGKLGPMSDALPYDHHRLCELAGEIIVNVRELAALGWTPATSSNFSRRLDDRHAAITVSGRDKGRLREADIMVVDFDGKAVGSDHRPSAEALLHTQLRPEEHTSELQSLMRISYAVFCLKKKKTHMIKRKKQ